MKPLKVVHKKLGKIRINKLQVDGYADTDLQTAFIDERLKGYQHIYVLIHEIIHLQNPTWSEIKVEGHSKQLAEVIWNENYRKVIL